MLLWGWHQISLWLSCDGNPANPKCTRGLGKTFSAECCCVQSELKGYLWLLLFVWRLRARLHISRRKILELPWIGTPILHNFVLIFIRVGVPSEFLSMMKCRMKRKNNKKQQQPAVSCPEWNYTLPWAWWTPPPRPRRRKHGPTLSLWLRAAKSNVFAILLLSSKASIMIFRISIVMPTEVTWNA